MCWTCNPMCGRCRPASIKTVICPDCGNLTMFDRDVVLDAAQPHVCAKCNRDVSDMLKIDPVECQKSGKWCAYPCGSFQKPLPEGHFDCPHNTPLELAS